MDFLRPRTVEWRRTTAAGTDAARWAPPTGGRLWWVYMIPCYHPEDMRKPVHRRRIIVGYIGETCRWNAVKRLAEHIDEKSWAYTIVDLHCTEPVIVAQFDPTLARFQVLAVRFTSRAAAQAMEQAQVELLKPLYNDEYNRGNPDRIPIYDQPRVRAAYDASVPRWQRWWARQRLWWTRKRLRRAAWAVLWAASAGALWWASARYAAVKPWWRAAGISVLLATVGVLWLRWPRRAWSRVLRVWIAIGVLYVLLIAPHPFG